MSAIVDDPLIQPVCPADAVTMRDHPRGYVCPSCGFIEDHSAEYDQIEMPPEFNGPSIHGG